MISMIISVVIAGICISVITSLLGNFMVWKGVSYLGDAIGHASLLGIAVGVLFNNIAEVWVFVICIIFAVTLTASKYIFNFAFESLIVLNVQLFLSLGLIIMGWFYISDGSTSLNYLFGDLFLISYTDIAIMAVMALIIVLYVVFAWHSLLLVTLNEELAYSENVKVMLNEMIFIILLSGSIAFLVKFVGVFLIPSLLIIPALTANNLSGTPIKCFIISGICSYVAILLGSSISFVIDIPVTPLITISACLIFLATAIVKIIKNC